MLIFYRPIYNIRKSSSESDKHVTAKIFEETALPAMDLCLQQFAYGIAIITWQYKTRTQSLPKGCKFIYLNNSFI